LNFFRYLEPFLIYKQNKFVFFYSVQKVRIFQKGKNHVFEEKYSKTGPIQDKFDLIFAAESLV